MAHINRSLLEELGAAAQGTLALLTGKRGAAQHFDFSLRGVAGSLIAFLLASTLVAYGPQLLGLPAAPGSASRALFLGFVLYVMQQGIAFAVLRALRRGDGFVPFLVADNWATFYTSLLSMLLLVLGGGSDVSLIVIGLVVIIVEVNIARLVVTLAPVQIVMFVLAQVAGSTMGLLVLAAIVPGIGIFPPA